MAQDDPIDVAIQALIKKVQQAHEEGYQAGFENGKLAGIPEGIFQGMQISLEVWFDSGVTKAKRKMIELLLQLAEKEEFSDLRKSGNLNELMAAINRLEVPYESSQ